MCLIPIPSPLSILSLFFYLGWFRYRRLSNEGGIEPGAPLTGDGDSIGTSAGSGRGRKRTGGMDEGASNLLGGNSSKKEI
jgi:hypothetical protein